MIKYIRNEIVKIFFGASTSELYSTIMMENYGINVKNDLPGIEDVTNYQNNMISESLMYDGLMGLEYYAHIVKSHDTCENDSLMSIAIFNYYWNTFVFESFSTPDINKTIFVAELPDPKFNATCVEIPRGYLILINRGMSLFITRVVKLLLGCTRLVYGDTKSEASFDISFAKSKMKVEIESLSLENKHYLPIPLRSEFHIRIYPVLINFIECWVFSHELGHCLVGNKHLKSSVDIEYEADKIGFELYSNLNSKFCQNYKSDHLLGAFSYAAPFIFFLICYSLDKCSNVEYDTHPLPKERAERLNKIASNYYSKEHIVLGEYFISILQDLTNF